MTSGFEAMKLELKKWTGNLREKTIVFVMGKHDIDVVASLFNPDEILTYTSDNTPEERVSICAQWKSGGEEIDGCDNWIWHRD